MRHKFGYKKLNRTSEHRKALIKNMLNSLIKYEQITTTLPKAKVLKPQADKIITLGKKDTLSNTKTLISPGPFASRINFFGSSDELFKAKDFTFSTISVTSSLTPLIDVNSCNTPSIWIDVTAVPLIEDTRILLCELPRVNP